MAIEVNWVRVLGDEWRGSIRGQGHLVLEANPYGWSVLQVDPTGEKEAITLAEGTVADHDVARASRRRAVEVRPLQLSRERAEKWLERNPEKSGLT